MSCTHGTRVDVIREIRVWIDTERPVFWLNGLAGTGKTTIAFTVASGFNEEGTLGASFFCSRDDAACSNHKLIFPSIAYQLGCFHAEFGKRLASVVKKHPDIVHAGVSYQLRKLIIEPLAIIDRFPTCIVVIDALDECKDDSSISIILAALSSQVDKHLPLKIILTSRPERSISLGFQEDGMAAATHKLALHEIQLSVVEADIKVYLTSQLKRIKLEYNIKGAWPSTLEVDALSTLSFGSFIFAATVIKLIQDRSFCDPNGQLARILPSQTSPKRSFQDSRHSLDQLYMQVLTNAHLDISEELGKRLKAVLGSIVLLQDPLSSSSIEKLLNTEVGVEQTLTHLHSIIFVPEDGTRVIRALHPSLFDFLTDPERCTDPRFTVDVTKQHTMLLVACLRQMQSLKWNLCELADSDVLNTEISHLPALISQHMPSELQYACRYWAAHCAQAIRSEEVLGLLQVFCTEQLLFWVEACSLLGVLRDQLILLDALQRTWITPEDANSTTTICLKSCKRLIREFFPAISIAWAHVYQSAIVFTPQESIIRKHHLYLSRLKVINGPRIWDLSSQIIEGHSDVVCSVIFSPDGKKILSSSYDNSIRSWDAVSGAHLDTFEEHTSAVTSAAFSPDGTRIASFSRTDQSIRLWDSVNGAQLQKLESTSHSLNSFVFSPDGRRILFGPEDEVFKIWDLNTGGILNVLQVKSSVMTCATFSPDGSRIISGSETGALQLWNAISGACLVTVKIIPNHHNVTCVEFSPDGSIFLSCSWDDNIRLCSTVDGTQMSLIRGGGSRARFAPDGTAIASGGTYPSDTISLWDSVTGALLFALKGHSKPIMDISFSPDGQYVVSASMDKTIRLWNVGPAIRSTHTHHASRPPLSAALKLAQKLLRGGQAIKPQPEHLNTYSARIIRMAFSPDATMLISAYRHGPPILWNAISGAHLKSLKGHSDKAWVVACSPDGTRVISGSHDCTVRLWDVAGGRAPKILKGHKDQVVSAIFAPDASLIAAGSADGKIRIWNACDGMHLLVIDACEFPVFEVAFSPDSTRIFCVGISGGRSFIGQWEATGGVPLKTVNMEDSFLQSLALPPDSTNIIVSGRNNKLHTFLASDLSPATKPTTDCFWERGRWDGHFPGFWIPCSAENSDLVDDIDDRLWAQPFGQFPLSYNMPRSNKAHIYAIRP
ncbi:hypothetical protein HWV62_7250 [Athelia sp. TMB]|nr:hypothetical protein HWV62_7250 [Athelia sp. TMB]